MDNLLSNKSMETNNLNLNTKQQLTDETFKYLQENCVKTEFGKAINNALDGFLKLILPDSIEDTVIDLKNNLYDYGLKEGLSKTVQNIIDTGKKAIGIETNNFESIEQVQEVIEHGGTQDKISSLLDSGVDKLKEEKSIDSGTAKTIKNEKNNIAKNIEENIENSFSEQLKSMQKLEKYITNWKNYYGQQNFSKMQNEYNKMKKIIDQIMPLEKTISDFRTIENLQNLIKNNGKKFALTQEELDLANKLIN